MSRSVQELPRKLLRHVETWPMVLLDEVAERGSGHTPSQARPEYWDGEIPWVSLADSWRLDKGLISETTRCITAAGVANSSAVIHPANTVILSRDAGVGKCAILARPMAVSQHFIAWSCGKHLDSVFLYYVLRGLKSEFERIAVGSTVQTIGLPHFKRLRVPLPPIREQRRIAALLATWDRAAGLLTSRIAASRRLRGLAIERHFQSATAPLIAIGEIASSTTRMNRNALTLPVLSCTKSAGLVLSSEYFGTSIRQAKLDRYQLIRRDEFAYATNHIEEGSIGVQRLYDEALISPMYTVFCLNSGQVHVDYLYAMLKTEWMRRRFASLTSASVNRRGSLRWPVFSKIKIPILSPTAQGEVVAAVSAMERQDRLMQDLASLTVRQFDELAKALMSGPALASASLVGSL